MGYTIKIGGHNYDLDCLPVYDVVIAIKGIKHRLPRSNMWKKYVAYLNAGRRHSDLRDANHFYYTPQN